MEACRATSLTKSNEISLYAPSPSALEATLMLTSGKPIFPLNRQEGPGAVISYAPLGSTATPTLPAPEIFTGGGTAKTDALRTNGNNKVRNNLWTPLQKQARQDANAYGCLQW